MPHHRPTTIAVLGADTVVENALFSLLLGGAGYSTKVLEEPSAPAANAEERRASVDLLLLTPSLREETQEGFLRAIEAALAPAPSSEPGGVERLPSKPVGHGGGATRKEFA